MEVKEPADADAQREHLPCRTRGEGGSTYLGLGVRVRVGGGASQEAGGARPGDSVYLPYSLSPQLTSPPRHSDATCATPEAPAAAGAAAYSIAGKPALAPARPLTY